MPRHTDPHPPPDNPNEGPVPHFPDVVPPPDRRDIGLEKPGRVTELPDYPPERKPFPDTVPDPGITH
jgi:hypothetical protein